MANQDHLEILKQGTEVWNTWRDDNPGISPDLRGAYLNVAQLQGASLWGTQLQGASLLGARLQEADLVAAKLQGAILWHAQLQGASLRSAQLQGANLQEAILEGYSVTEDGQPGEDLRPADLTDASLRDTNLGDAKLSTVIGLRAENLGGSILANATPPPDIAKFDKLRYVEETSKHAGTTFVALWGASLYSWLTMAMTTDIQLVNDSTSAALPIINTAIPLSGFYLAAPLILLSIYLYLHLYLQRLWSGLATLPAVFPDGETLDVKAYPWLLNGLVRAHFMRLRLYERPLSRLENVVSITLAWWVVPATLAAFWIRYLPRHDWLGTWLHVVVLTVAVGFGVRTYRLAVRTLKRSATGERDAAEEQDQPFRTWLRQSLRSYRPKRWTSLTFTLALIYTASTCFAPGMLDVLGPRTVAHLLDAELSVKPPDWSAKDVSKVKGADLRGRDLRRAAASGAFLARGRLEQADFSDARLDGADLRSANLTRTQLQGAWLKGADLSGANFAEANLRNVNLAGANLRNAQALTQRQLNRACGDAKTLLPPNLKVQACKSETAGD